MRPSDSCRRLFAQIVAALFVLPLVSAAYASSGEEGSAPASAGSGVKLAQQGKAPATAPAPAPAKSAQVPPAEEPAAWAVNCSDQGQQKFTCEMTQNLIDQKSNSQVMLISIKKVTGGDAKAMLIRFFHGVFLPPGVSVKVDGGQPTAIAFQKSDRLGVYAALPLTDRMVADMKKGKDLKFGLQINQGEPLEIVARLNGFGPAYDRISSMP